jgi:steroid delta-isomerase-like uncharacterized protein
MAQPRDPMLKEFRVIDEKGPDAVADICDLFTDDCILEDTSSREYVRGREGLREYCEDLLRIFPDFHVEPQEIYEDGKTAVMVLNLSGTHSADFLGFPPSGKKIEWRAVAVYRCNDELTKVHYETFAYDTGIITRQIEGETA